MFIRLFLISLLLPSAAAVHAQDPVKVRFLRVDKSQSPLPPLVHLALELENPSSEPRWLLLSLSRQVRLPKDGKFASEPEAGLPFFVLAAKDDKARAAMIGFLGEPRFTAFYLPAGAKIALDDFEFPSIEDLSEIDWLEAKTLLVNGKTPLEKWLPVDVQSTTVKLSKDAVWADALRDPKTGEPRNDLPGEKVASVNAEVVRAGRLSVEGFDAPARFYQLDKTGKPATLPAGWNLLASFRPVRPLKVEALAFSPDGSWLAASLQTFKIVGLDLDKKRERIFPMGEKNLARFFAFSPDGHLLVKQATTGSEDDGHLDLADWTAGKVLDVLRFSSRATLGNIDHVPAPDGQRVAVMQLSSFNVWDFAKLESVGRLSWPDSAKGFTYRVGLFSPDGKRFAAGLEHPTLGGKAVVWNVADGKVIAEFSSKQNGIQHLSFSGDGALLAGAGKTASQIWVWSVDAKDEKAVIRDIPFSNVHAIALSPDGATLAAAVTPFAGGDATRGVDVFDVATKQKLGSLPGLRQPVTALTFSRDSRRLAGGDQVGAIRVWGRE